MYNIASCPGSRKKLKGGEPGRDHEAGHEYVAIIVLSVYMLVVTSLHGIRCSWCMIRSTQPCIVA